MTKKLKSGEIPLKLVMVKWLDSCSGRNWQTLKDLRIASEPLYCKSVGWLLTKTAKCTTIVPHIYDIKNQDTTMCGCGELHIPTKAIISLRILNEPKRIKIVKKRRR